MSERTATALDRWSDPGTRLLWPGVVLVEASLVVAYFAVTTAEPATGRYLVYPFVWINAGLWAVDRTTPAPGSRRHRWLAAGLAAGYFLLVMWIPGQIRLGTVRPDHLGFGLQHLRVAWQAPGWGPVLAYDGVLRLYLVPFEVVGYAALAYLVYATLLDATRGALSGALGLATCVGCTVPVVAPLAGLLGGPATGLATTAYAWSYDIGTILFLLTLGLLYRSHREGRS